MAINYLTENSIRLNYCRKESKIEVVGHGVVLLKK